MAIDQKKWGVLGFGSVDLDPAKVQQALDGADYSYLLSSLKTLIKKNIVGTLPSNHVVLSIPTSRTYARTFAVPPEVEKNLADAVASKSSNISHYQVKHYTLTMR